MSRRETGEGKRAVAQYESFLQLAKRLLHPTQVSPSARTIEIFGYVMLAEGTTIFVATRSVAALLGLPDLSAPGLSYFRLVGLLVSGLGMLYAVSGRLNAQGLVFASLLDRPMVPLIMLGLWYWELCPAILAAAFGLQDFCSFLW